MAKPFSIQAPENIAKEYAGNKQKIAQAAQMGIVDPTAAVLAGMFIDRMRSAQVMEAGQQPTVAQQVFSGQPPQGAPPPPQQGMGAPPPMGAPPQQMPMAPPPQDMGMAPPPQGMAMGGLASLPVPDAMFDEPTNGGYDDGYAGGGMVAFAAGGKGGMASLYDDVEYWESGGDQNAISKAGARGVMQLMPGTMKDPGFGVPSMAELRAKGLSEEDANRLAGRKYLDAMYRKYGDEATALAAYNWGPGNVDKWLKKGGDPKQLPAETKKYIGNILGGKATPKLPERDLSTAAGVGMSYEDAMPLVDRLLARSPEHEAAREAFRARATEMGSDEYYEKERKDDMYQTLAEIGFNMASSKSPYVLQAIGEAASAAMPGARADKKERKALKDRALQGLIMLGEGDEKKAREALNLTMDMTKTNIQASQFERELASRETIAANELVASLAATAAKNQIDPNSKQQFIQTFYDQFIEKGYSPTLARQYAYITAEKALAKVKGTGENLFGEEEETGGAAATGSTANTLDYGSLKD